MSIVAMIECLDELLELSPVFFVVMDIAVAVVVVGRMMMLLMLMLRHD